MIETTHAYNVADIPGLKELWEKTLGDPQISIAILDGPVDQSHPSLAAANLTKVETFISSTSDQGAASQHGTHITSVIFGQHDGSVSGISPQCRGLILPVFSDGANGSVAPCSQLDLARAISQAVQEGAHIINISGGELTPSGTAHPLLADTVRDCAAKGVLIVAAAGNQGCECLHIPGALPSVLTVGAMSVEENPLEFSNWGEKYKEQGILAPGENILGAIPSGGSEVSSGTSYATPIVTGIVALLLSLQLKLGKKPDPHFVRAAILNSAIGCDEKPIPNCNRLLVGRLNLKGALTEITKKGGGIMANSTEKKESLQTQVDENVEQKKTEAQETMAGVKASTSDDSNPESSDNGSQHLTTNSVESHENGTMENIAQVEASNVNASACNCGSDTTAQLVFCIGQLGYDFGTEARRDSIMQSMEDEDHPNPNPHDPVQLLAYLENNPWDAAAIIWTLNFDATPIYAIQSQSTFTSHIYERLRGFLCEQIGGVPTETGGCEQPASNQIAGKVERISIPGYISGSARLFTGQVVPIIWPELRGMYSWNTDALVGAVCGKPPIEKESKQEKDEYIRKGQAIANFLLRVYEEIRNLGITCQERAINYAATNALLVAKVFEDAIKEEMQLDTIEVERSPICRLDSDCWDVKLTFFNPRKVFEQARKVYRFTIDVSDFVPVMVGPVRSWFVR